MKTVAVALSWDLWQALAFLRVHVIVISALVLSLFFLFFILRNFAVTLFYVSSLTTPSVSFPLAYVEPNSRHSLAVNNATRCSAVFLRPFSILYFLSQSVVHSLSPANKTQSLLKWLQSLGTNKCAHYTGLFEMIVGVLTTCHTQYTWDSSICIFYLIEQHSNFLLHTLQVLYMCTLCDSTNINTIIEFVPNCL